MAQERSENEEKEQSKPRDLMDFDEDEIESDALLELILMEANERLSDAEEEYEEAQEETEAIKSELDDKQKEVDAARKAHTKDPSDDNRHNMLQAMFAKKEITDKLNEAKAAERESKADYEKALKRAIIAEVRKDYSDLKPQAESLKKLEDKHRQLTADIANFKAQGNDDAAKSKTRKLENLDSKISAKKDKLANVVDNLLSKRGADFKKSEVKARPVEKQNTEQSQPEAAPKSNQIEYRTVSAQFLLNESIRHEAALRQQLNSMNQKQEIFKKLIAGKSQYAEKSEIRGLKRGLETLERVGRKLSHEISHENKVMEKLKAGIAAGQTEVIRPLHKRASEPVFLTQPTQEKAISSQPEISAPLASSSQASDNQTPSTPQAPINVTPDPSISTQARKPEHGKAKQIISQVQAGDEASKKRNEAVEKYISLSMLVENEIMESLKKGENVEQNLGEGVQTMLDVIDVVVARNALLKDENELHSDRQMIHKQKADMEYREKRSLPSEIKYGVYERKPDSQTGTGAGSAVSAEGSSIAPARSGNTKLK